MYGNANNGSMGFHRVVAIDFTGIMIHVRNQFRFSSWGTDALSKNAARVCAQAAFCSMQASSGDCRFFRQSAAPGLSLPPPQRRHRERADYNRGFMLLPHRCHPLCSNASRSMATASRWPLLFNRNTMTRCFLRPVIASTKPIGKESKESLKEEEEEKEEGTDFFENDQSSIFIVLWIHVFDVTCNYVCCKIKTNVLL